MPNLEDLKRLTRTPEFLAEMEAIFFEAANDGYVDNPKRSAIIELPGSVEITFTEGSWSVVDKYFKTPLGRRSGGGVVMSYEGVPVWMMQYLGQYEKEAIPCLKVALNAAYAAKKFFGGRGPKEFVYEGLVYRNEVDRAYRGNFAGSNFFQGYEKIQRQEKGPSGEPGRVLGWHSYQGMLMIPAP